jgi:hypothetical protein
MSFLLRHLRLSPQFSSNCSPWNSGTRLTILSLSLRLILLPKVSRPVCLGIKHPSGANEQIFITVRQLQSSFMSDALSDERTDLSFLYAAGPCQHILSLVRVPCNSRPYFTLSDSRLPFSSPPTTRRVSMEVFDPASRRGTHYFYRNCFL